MRGLVINLEDLCAIASLRQVSQAQNSHLYHEKAAVGGQVSAETGL
jgi:hypothetical protein